MFEDFLTVYAKKTCLLVDGRGYLAVYKVKFSRGMLHFCRFCYIYWINGHKIFKRLKILEQILTRQRVIISFTFHNNHSFSSFGFGSTKKATQLHDIVFEVK